MNRIALLPLATLLIFGLALVWALSNPFRPTPTASQSRLLQRQSFIPHLIPHLPPTTAPSTTTRTSLTIANTPIERATDPRGGVFFRVHTQPDEYGVDTTSTGYAFQPNRQGTPFGNTSYRLSPITTDWYWFTANNDW